MVAAPLQDVHPHERGIGELNEEDLLARDRGEALRVRTSGQNVEAVETDTESGVVCCLDDAPGTVVRVDVTPPRQRLVGDADPVLVRQYGQFAQLRRGQGVVVAGVRGDVGTRQDGVDAELGCMTRNLCSARRMLRANASADRPSTSLIGW